MFSPRRLGLGLGLMLLPGLVRGFLRDIPDGLGRNSRWAPRLLSARLASSTPRLGDLRAEISGIEDSQAITAFTKALRQCKAQLMDTLAEGGGSWTLDGLDMMEELMGVNPLPSPAFAGNLLVGSFGLRGWPNEWSEDWDQSQAEAGGGVLGRIKLVAAGAGLGSPRP